MVPTPSLLVAIALGWTLPASAAVFAYRIREAVPATDGVRRRSEA
jgi:hypothetical protein